MVELMKMEGRVKGKEDSVNIMENPVKELARLGGNGIRGGLKLGKDGLVNSLNSFSDPNPGTAKISGMLAITSLVGFLALQAYNGIRDDVPPRNTSIYAPIIRNVEQESSHNERSTYKTLTALTGAVLLGAGAVLGTQSYRNRTKKITLEDMPEVRDAVKENYRN